MRPLKLNNNQKPIIEISKSNGRIFRGALVNFGLVNVLPQVRKTFDPEEIRLLAEDIAKSGIIQPSIIALFDEVYMEKYIHLNDSVARVKTDISKLTSFKYRNRRFYLVVLGGERRYRAHKYLWDKGCESCREKYGSKMTSGKCFIYHFGGHHMEARLCENISAEVAKEYQFKENNYISPPSHELAYHYVEYFKTISLIYRERGEKLTIRDFAKKVGRSESTIRNAISFVELPDYIQQAVAGKHISYSIALEFHRLKAQGVDETAIRNLFLIISVKFRIKAETVREKITQYLMNISEPELDFGNSNRLSPKRTRRKVVQGELVPLFMQMTSYLNEVGRLHDLGHLGRNKSIYSDASVGRMVKRFLRAAVRILPISVKGNFQEPHSDLKRVSRHVRRLKIPA